MKKIYALLLIGLMAIVLAPTANYAADVGPPCIELQTHFSCYNDIVLPVASYDIPLPVTDQVQAFLPLRILRLDIEHYALSFWPIKAINTEYQAVLKFLMKNQKNPEIVIKTALAKTFQINLRENYYKRIGSWGYNLAA